MQNQTQETQPPLTLRQNLDDLGDDPTELLVPLEEVTITPPLVEGAEMPLWDAPMGSLVAVNGLEGRLTNKNEETDTQPATVTIYVQAGGLNERRPVNLKPTLVCRVLAAPPPAEPQWAPPPGAEVEEPANEVGASLTEHMAAQVPQAWPPELVRNDVPAYVAPEDRNAWLPVAEGSWWVWSSREEKPVVQVTSVEGPSQESMVTIRVPFSTAEQRWVAKDFGDGQRFEPIPDLTGQLFMSFDRVVFKVVELGAGQYGDRILLHDHGAAEPEWDDLSAMLRALAAGKVRLATPEEAASWSADGDEEPDEPTAPTLAEEVLGPEVCGETPNERSAATDDRNLGQDGLYDVTPDCPTCGPYSFRVRFIGDGLIQPCPKCGKGGNALQTKAHEWLAMIHPYPALGLRNDDGMEIASELAEMVGVEYAPPSGLSESKLADSIAMAIKDLLEDLEWKAREADSREAERESRESEAKAQAEPPKRRTRRNKADQQPTAAPPENPTSFEEIKAARDAALAEAAQWIAKADEAKQRADQFAKQLEDGLQAVRARKLAELEELDRLAAELGVSA